VSDISLRPENICYVFQVWDIRTHKLKQDLPGHADEVSCFFYLIVVHKQTETLINKHDTFEHYKVYAVDWSPDGEKVASGGKDRVLKLWMN
jgi:ribosome assembly protein 4